MSEKILGMLLGLLLLPLIAVISGVIALVIAWPVMLFIGNAAIASDGIIPSLSYHTTFWLTWAVLLLTGGASNN